MMHRDEAIYARSDARGITLTAEEARLAAEALHAAFPGNSPEFHDADVLAARLEAASTTSSP